jgi:hypothetical protein
MFDVIIVGGGPVGLFLACELKLAGIDHVVLERLPQASQADKAHGIGGQVVRLLDHRGLFERFGGQGAPTPAPAFYFGTLPVPLHILGADNPTYVLPINQRDIERVLGERAAELGVDVRREVELRSFTHRTITSISSSTARAASQSSARVISWAATALTTMIRQESGITFPGTFDEQIVSRAALIAPTEHIQPTAPSGSSRRPSTTSSTRPRARSLTSSRSSTPCSGGGTGPHRRSTTRPLSVSDTELPDEVAALLNDAAAGGEQAVQPLFTVDDQGCPHATLSSARQWWTGDEHLVCVLVAGRTTRYLAQRPQALLLVIGARQAYSVRLHATQIQEMEDRRDVVVFDVTAVESDTRGVALTPMLFQATAELARQERIGDRAAATAARLAGQP